VLAVLTNKESGPVGLGLRTGPLRLKRIDLGGLATPATASLSREAHTKRFEFPKWPKLPQPPELPS